MTISRCSSRRSTVRPRDFASPSPERDNPKLSALSTTTGGIFSLPPFLSPEARYLLSRMLLVDSNKRIKLHEIRQLPWFQKDLPAYLFANTTATPSAAATPDDEHDEDSPLVEGDQPSSSTWTDTAPASERGRRREWVDGLGVVDQEIVDDLCRMATSFDSEKVWRSLKATATMTVEERKGDHEGNQIRIAYQLCRDNKRMVEGCECPFPFRLRALVFALRRFRGADPEFLHPAHFEDTEAIQSFYAPQGIVRFPFAPPCGPFLPLPTQSNQRQPTIRRKAAIAAEKEEPEARVLPVPKENTIRVLASSLPRAPEGPLLPAVPLTISLTPVPPRPRAPRTLSSPTTQAPLHLPPQRRCTTSHSHRTHRAPTRCSPRRAVRRTNGPTPAPAVALWDPVAVRADGGHARDLPHLEGTQDGVETEAVPER